MGYLFLSFALAAGLAKGFCGKKISGSTQTLADASLINLLRMACCVLIGACLMLAGGVIPFADFDAPTILAAALSVIFTSVFVVTWLISVRSGAYVMLDVFLMLGVSVTVSCCRISLVRKFAQIRLLASLSLSWRRILCVLIISRSTEE